MRKKAEEKANVKILYLKCQFFPKTRSLFPKKRAYFSLYCHLRNCIFMHIARAQVPPPAPRPSVRVRRFPRAQVSVSGGSPAGPTRCNQQCNKRCKNRCKQWRKITP